MQKLKPWLVKLPLMVSIGWILYGVLDAQGFLSFLILVVVLGVFGLVFYSLMWAAEKIFNVVTGSKQKHQEADLSLSGLENLNFEDIKFDLPTGHHAAAGLSHLPECEDIVSTCIEGVSSCLEGLHH